MQPERPKLTSAQVREFALQNDHVAIPIRPGLTITWTDEESGEVIGSASINGRNVVSLAVPKAPPLDQKKIHNDNVERILREIWRLVGQSPPNLNVFVESLLVGAGMLNFPGDPRRQALIIQEISDAAQDRAKAVGS